LVSGGGVRREKGDEGEGEGGGRREEGGERREEGGGRREEGGGRRGTLTSVMRTFLSNWTVTDSWSPLVSVGGVRIGSRGSRGEGEGKDRRRGERRRGEEEGENLLEPKKTRYLRIESPRETQGGHGLPKRHRGRPPRRPRSRGKERGRRGEGEERRKKREREEKEENLLEPKKTRCPRTE
jgi:hypothetical protein